MGSLSENPEGWSIHTSRSVHPQGRTPDRRPILALTQFRCGRRSWRADEPRLQEVELSTPIHLSLDQFQPGDLTFGLTVRPRRGDGGADRSLIVEDATSEGGK